MRGLIFLCLLNLVAYRTVFVDGEIKHYGAAIDGNGGEHSARVWGPGNVSHLATQVVHHQGTRVILRGVSDAKPVFAFLPYATH